LESPIFFWTSLILVHGISYHRHILRHYSNGATIGASKTLHGARFLAIYGFLILGAASTWYIINQWLDIGLQTGLNHKFAVSFKWMPLLAHYYFDSQLWRTPKQHFSLHKILTTM
jgi:hypothetical protein